MRRSAPRGGLLDAARTSGDVAGGVFGVVCLEPCVWGGVRLLDESGGWAGEAAFCQQCSAALRVGQVEAAGGPSQRRDSGEL